MGRLMCSKGGGTSSWPKEKIELEACVKPFGLEDQEGRCGMAYGLVLEELDCTAAAAPEDLHVGS